MLNSRSFKLLKIGAELSFHLDNVIALTAFFDFEIIAVNKSSYRYPKQCCISNEKHEII